MSLFYVENPCPITVSNHSKVNKFAFDGVHYYYTLNCESCIGKVNSSCVSEQFLSTSKIYDCICYDTDEKCFWATTKNNYTTIFKLDCSMKEIDCIFIDTQGRITGNISSISYDCGNNSIYVAYPTYVLEVYKNGDYIIRYQQENAYITSVFSLSPYYYVCVFNNEKQYIYGFNSSNSLVYEEKVKSENQISSIIFNPEDESENWYLDILFKKNNCYPYLEKNLVTADTLGFTPSDCNFTILTDGGCGTIVYCDPIADFVESIALIEASVAHILNAEGEKIQYAVAQETDMDTILSVNKSVTKTITQVTHLEQVLHGILETLAEQGICFDTSNCCL